MLDRLTNAVMHLFFISVMAEGLALALIADDATFISRVPGYTAALSFPILLVLLAAKMFRDEKLDARQVEREDEAVIDRR
jgi:hypothetical protein